MPKKRYFTSIRALRTSRQRTLTQTELAELACCAQSTLSMIEEGYQAPDLVTALRIAFALGRPVEEVFFDLAEHVMVDVVDRDSRTSS